MGNSLSSESERLNESSFREVEEKLGDAIFIIFTRKEQRLPFTLQRENTLNLNYAGNDL